MREIFPERMRESVGESGTNRRSLQRVVSVSTNEMRCKLKIAHVLQSSEERYELLQQ